MIDMNWVWVDNMVHWFSFFSHFIIDFSAYTHNILVRTVGIITVLSGLFLGLPGKQIINLLPWHITPMNYHKCKFDTHSTATHPRGESRKWCLPLNLRATDQGFGWSWWCWNFLHPLVSLRSFHPLQPSPLPPPKSPQLHPNPYPHVHTRTCTQYPHGLYGPMWARQAGLHHYSVCNTTVRQPMRSYEGEDVGRENNICMDKGLKINLIGFQMV